MIEQKASIDARFKWLKIAVATKESPPSPSMQPVAARETTTRRESPPEIADAVQAIKGLVDVLGVEQVKRIASLFAS